MESAFNPRDAQQSAMTTPTSLAELYEAHYAAVYRTALRVTGNPTDAEDVLQTVFLRMIHQREIVDARMPEAYFRRAAANAAIDLLRRRTAHAEIPLKEASPPQIAKESTAFLKERLRRAIAALEQSDALLFLLRHVEGFSNGELAEMFGLEKNNIAVRLHRIRQLLQIEMDR